MRPTNARSREDGAAPIGGALDIALAAALLIALLAVIALTSSRARHFPVTW